MPTSKKSPKSTNIPSYWLGIQLGSRGLARHTQGPEFYPCYPRKKQKAIVCLQNKLHKTENRNFKQQKKTINKPDRMDNNLQPEYFKGRGRRVITSSRPG